MQGDPQQPFGPDILNARPDILRAISGGAHQAAGEVAGQRGGCRRLYIRNLLGILFIGGLGR
jgi:hypothetical protein